MTSTSDPVPTLFNVDEALRRLGSGCRRWLLGHLRAHPFHGGQPTHRRVGKRIMFTEEDFARLLDTLAPSAPARPSHAPAPRWSAGKAPPSAERAVELALARAEAGMKRRPVRPREGRAG